jgi:outer membrane protein OmpU
MKKVLLATSALVAFAGAAAADVKLSGYGRIVGQYNEVTGDVTKVTRLRFNIDASAQTDNGIGFSGRVRLQGDNGNPATLNGSSMTVSASGLAVTVGNISGAIESMPGYYMGEIALTGLAYANTFAAGVDAYSSAAAGRNGVRVAYSMGDVSLIASMSNEGAEDRSALSASFNAGGWTLAVGYQDSSNDANDLLIATAQGSVGAASVGFLITDTDAGTGYGATAGFAVGAATNVTVTANRDAAEATTFGLGMTHDLGGATLGAGVASSDGDMTAELGVVFNF